MTEIQYSAIETALKMKYAECTAQELLALIPKPKKPKNSCGFEECDAEDDYCSRCQ